MTTKLKISTDLSLPLDFVTGTQGILATKGKGKTYLAQVQAEELLDHGQVIVAIDPTDAWWGLRSSADGKSDGYPIAVFGGDHGDVKLEKEAGAELAEAIVAERFSAVICTEGLSASGEVRFVREFLGTLYRKNRDPLHVFVDEADMFAPQKPFDPEDAKSIRAMSNIVRRGRKKGIGCTMITQRPSVLNKDVLSQVDMLMVLGMSHNLDIEPIEKWMRLRKMKSGDNTAHARVEEMLESLSSLPQGDAWAWSPSTHLHVRFRAREKRTFDSGATPKPGQKAREAKKLAQVDIVRLGQKIAATVERAKQDDPKALKARVAELEKQLAAQPAPVAAKTETKVVEKPVIKEAQLQRIGVLIDQGEKLIERWDNKCADAHEALVAVEQKTGAHFATLFAHLKDLRAAIDKTKAPNILAAPRVATPRPTTRTAAPVTNGRATVSQDIPGGKLPVGEVKTLRALIQYPDGLGRSQLTVLTGYKRSTRDAYIARLKEKGMCAVEGERIVVTAEGQAALPNAEPLPTGDALREFWDRTLPEGERKILGVLCEVYPHDMPRNELDDRTPFKRSTRDAYLSRLAAKQLVVESGRGSVKASDTLFEVAS